MAGLPAMLTLILVHVFAGCGPLGRLRRGAWLSFSGGAAAAYVFLYILPTQNDLSYDLAVDEGLWPDGEYVFVAALAGTCMFHALETYACRSRRASGSASPEALRFWVHIAAFAFYNLLVGALFVVKPYAHAFDALVYQSALILHFTVIDLTLRDRFPQAYDRVGRWIMAAAVLVGWLIGHYGVDNLHAAGSAFAFLAGGMILNVLKEELSETDHSSPLPFLLGAAFFALLFLVARMSY